MLLSILLFIFVCIFRKNQVPDKNCCGFMIYVQNEIKKQVKTYSNSSLKKMHFSPLPIPNFDWLTSKNGLLNWNLDYSILRFYSVFIYLNSSCSKAKLYISCNLLKTYVGTFGFKTLECRRCNCWNSRCPIQLLGIPS